MFLHILKILIEFDKKLQKYPLTGNIGSIINTVDNKYQPYLNLQKNRKECKIPL